MRLFRARVRSRSSVISGAEAGGKGSCLRTFLLAWPMPVVFTKKSTGMLMPIERKSTVAIESVKTVEMHVFTWPAPFGKSMGT